MFIEEMGAHRIQVGIWIDPNLLDRKATFERGPLEGSEDLLIIQEESHSSVIYSRGFIFQVISVSETL